MPRQEIDYEALAKQYGAVSSEIDYNALAAQHGAMPAPPTESDKWGTPTSATSVGTFTRSGVLKSGPGATYIPGVGTFSTAGIREFGRAFSDYAAHAVNTIGLGERLANSPIADWFSRPSTPAPAPAPPPGLSGGGGGGGWPSAEQAMLKQTLKPSPKPTVADLYNMAKGPAQAIGKLAAPTPLGAIEMIKAAPGLVAGQVRAAEGGIAGGGEAVKQSLRGGISLINPNVPAPTEPEFKRAVEGAVKFAEQVPTYAGLYEAGTAGIKGIKARYAIKPYQQDADLGTLIQSAVKEKGAQTAPIVRTTRPSAKQFYHDTGLDPGRTPLTNRSPNINELNIGGTEAELAQANHALEQQHNAGIANGSIPPGTPFKPATSLQLAAFDYAVDVEHQPIGDAMRLFANVNDPNVANAVIRDMQKHAREALKVGDTAQARAYLKQVKLINNTGGNLGELYAQKVRAGKVPNMRNVGTPGQQIAADITLGEANAKVGDSIRKHLYPAVEQLGLQNGQPMQGALIEAGRREHAAILARDGIYNSWTKAYQLQNPADTERWLHYVLHGGGELPTSIFGNPFSQVAKARVGMRMVKGIPAPMADFNKLFARGLGSMEGFVPRPPTAITPQLGTGAAAAPLAPAPGGLPGVGAGGAVAGAGATTALPTPPQLLGRPWAASTTANLKDLEGMIADFVREHPGAPDHLEDVRDLQTIREELARRTGAGAGAAPPRPTPPPATEYDFVPGKGLVPRQ